VGAVAGAGIGIGVGAGVRLSGVVVDVLYKFGVGPGVGAGDGAGVAVVVAVAGVDMRVITDITCHVSGRIFSGIASLRSDGLDATVQLCFRHMPNERISGIDILRKPKLACSKDSPEIVDNITDATEMMVKAKTSSDIDKSLR
jgi:hypothetical protein